VGAGCSQDLMNPLNASLARDSAPLTARRITNSSSRGPGDENGCDDERLLPDAYLPGGVDHTTFAVGGGSLGLVLLGIAGAFKRRWTRRRNETLDE
jgi:hypothetical protein